MRIAGKRLTPEVALQVAMYVVHVLMFIQMTSYVVDGHGHGHIPANMEKPTGFHDDKVVHDREHISEHLDGVAELNVSEMSPGELEFHYFKLHDFDNNSRLDGLEIYKALTHLMPYEDMNDAPSIDTQGKTKAQVMMEKSEAESKYYTDIIDTVLQEDDLNEDGYLTYTEYLIARHREEYAREQEEEKKKKEAINQH